MTSTTADRKLKKPFYVCLGGPGSLESELAVEIAEQTNVTLISAQPLLRPIESPFHDEVPLDGEEPVIEVSLQVMIERLTQLLESEEVLFRGCVVDGSLFHLDPKVLDCIVDAIEKSSDTHTLVLVRLQMSDDDRIARYLEQMVDPLTGAVYYPDQLRGLKFPTRSTFETRDDSLKFSIDEPEAVEEGADEEEGEKKEGEENQAPITKKALDKEFKERPTDLEKLLIIQNKFEYHSPQEDLDAEEGAEKENEDEEAAAKAAAAEEQRRRHVEEIKERVEYESTISKNAIKGPDAEIMSRLVKRPENTEAEFRDQLTLFKMVHEKFMSMIASSSDGYLLNIEGTQSKSSICLHFYRWHQLNGSRLFEVLQLPTQIPDTDELKTRNPAKALKELETFGLPEGAPSRLASAWGTRCPVLFYEKKVLDIGVLDYVVQYKNVIYVLADKQNMHKFMRFPDRYLQNPEIFKPLCVLTIGLKNEKVAEQISSEFDVPIVKTSEFGDDIYSELQTTTATKGWIITDYPRSLAEAESMVADGIHPTHIVIPRNFDASQSEIYQAFAKKCPFSKILAEPASSMPLKQLRKIQKRCILIEKPEACFIEEEELGSGYMYSYYKNYCPVALVDDGILCRGRFNLSAKYNNQYYLFSNEARREKFLQQYWNYSDLLEPVKLPPPRISVIGPKYSGKSTVSRALRLQGVKLVDFAEFYRKHFKDLPQVDPPLEIDSFDKYEEIPSEALNFLLEQLFFGEEYRHTGFIVEGFPRHRNDLSSCIRSSKVYTFDVIIALSSQDRKCIERGLNDPKYIGMTSIEIDELRDKLADIFDRGNEGVTEVVEACQEIKEPLFELTGESIHRALQNFQTQFHSCLHARESLLLRISPVTPEEFANFQACGMYSPTSYGNLCPVDCNANFFLSKQCIGFQPVVVDHSIVYVHDAKNQKELTKNCAQLLGKESPSCSLIPGVVLVGPPKCGKTLVAKRLALDFDLSVLTVDEAIKTFIEASPESNLAKRISQCVTENKEVDVADKVQVLALMAKRVVSGTKGWLIDGFPLTLEHAQLMEDFDLKPTVVVELSASTEVCQSRNLQGLQISSEEADKLTEEFKTRDAIQRDQLVKLRQFYSQTYEFEYFMINANRHIAFLMKEVTHLIVETINEREEYIHARRNDRPALSYHSGILTKKAMDTALAKTGYYCPVALQEKAELCLVSSPRFAVEFKRKVFYTHSLEAARKFIDYPDNYFNVELPADIPKRITDSEQTSKLFPKSMEFQGYCPVSLSKHENVLEGAIPGEVDYIALYKHKYYTFANEECMEAFLHFPEKYVHFTLPFRLPPRRLDVLSPELPIVGYLEQSVAGLINQALLSVGKTRPKFPFKPLTASSAQFLYHYLKGNNPNASEYSKKEHKQRLVDFITECDTLHRVAKEMTRTYISPENRSPDFDKNMLHVLSIKKSS